MYRNKRRRTEVALYTYIYKLLRLYGRVRSNRNSAKILSPPSTRAIVSSSSFFPLCRSLSLGRLSVDGRVSCKFYRSPSVCVSERRRRIQTRGKRREKKRHTLKCRPIFIIYIYYVGIWHQQEKG